MKKIKLDKSTFILGYYIPQNICNNLIKLYKINKHRHGPGATGVKDVNESIKKSTEFTIEPQEFDTLLKDYFTHLQNVLEKYKKKYPYSDVVAKYSLYDNVKIQHYKPGEGFYNWHTENDGHGNSKLRHLVFMTYLNTVENAGTEFYHQNLITPCHKGLTLIWPAQWTHLHRGIINKTKEKYIITGWFNFLC